MATAKRKVFVYDLRTDLATNQILEINEILTFSELCNQIIASFSISNHEKDTIILTTTNRERLNVENYHELLETDDTLYILSNIDQDLPSQTKQKVEFLPHYDTIVKSGMYEYYDSEGQNPLPYAFAELIDNSLAATVKNVGKRTIELRLILDDCNADKSAIFVIDNGYGMNPCQLKNWAVYRLSKFIRKDKTFTPIKERRYSTSVSDMPRSLNSEISYFGVGGKQAIFFIGNATRMVTKPEDSKDVHELCISKEQFEKKELNKEFVYSGEIRNRKPGDNSHLKSDEELLKKIIEEETGKEKFTCVAIWGITNDHVHFLRQNFSIWCTQLAHIYHYYLHGPNGNILNSNLRTAESFGNIEITVKMLVKGCNPKIINLRDIDEDMQTQYIRTSVNTFEFKATVDSIKIVEGLIRYHPFLYDHETYPTDPSDIRESEDDHNYQHVDSIVARGPRPIFECFWNGRLIPYTPIKDFEWCSTQKKSRTVPPECYSRISGVLWTNDAFKVSTNKLTFLDLEHRLKDKNTIFTRLLCGQEKRGSIEKQFLEWLQKSHQDCDKQIHFTGFQGLVTRPELQKHRQSPWAVYDSIEWDGKLFNKGQLVRTQRTVPVILGKIIRFMLFGEHSGDVYGTGGDFDVQQQPQAIYDEVKSFSLTKLDRKSSDLTLKKSLDSEEEKLPASLEVTWPEGDQILDNEERAAGQTIGAIKVQISNRRKEFINKLPGSQKKILIELKVTWHSPKGDVVISQFLSQHAKHWPYWFRKMENIKELGPHTLQLQSVLSEGETTLCGKPLPSHKIHFTVKEAGAEKFSVGLLEGPIKIGVPFSIPLDFQDSYGNSTKPNNNMHPHISTTGLELSYTVKIIKNKTLIIREIIAHGQIDNIAGKNFLLTINIPGLTYDTQNLKVRILPGIVSQLLVKPEDVLEIENNSAAHFDLKIVDICGNVTCEPKMIIACKFLGAKCKELPNYKADLSASGKSSITGSPLFIKNMTSVSELISANFEIQNHPEVLSVERQLVILPSRKATSMRITYQDVEGKRSDIEPDRDIIWTAGNALTGLEFLVYDEGGRPIKITPALASKLKVNWVSKGVKDVFMAGKLPNIETPASVKQQLYCNISLSDSSVIDFGFTIKPIPGEAVSMKAICSDSNQLRLSESLASDILVNITDKNGNQIKKLPFKSLTNLLVIADELDYTCLEKALGQTSSFVLKGIRFSDFVLGHRDVLLQFKNLENTIRLEVIAGQPAKIIYPNYDPADFVTIHNDSPLPHPLIVQICDAKLNPTAEPNIKVQLGIDEGLKVTPSIHTVKTDSKGQAVFGNLVVTVRSNQQPSQCPGQICAQNCRGIFSICAKAVCNRLPIMGALIKLHIPCDPLRPINIKVEHSTPTKMIVNKEIPEFRVQILSEDGGIIKNIKPAQISLKMTNKDVRLAKKNQNSPSKANTFTPTEFRDTTGLFYFRGIKTPSEVGNYAFQFLYSDVANHLTSEIIPLEAIPDVPVKLVPSYDPGIPAVSNTAKIASRCLLNNLILHFQDENNNIVSNSNLNGSLNVQITLNGGTKGEIPRMVGNVTSVELPIIEGQVILQNITIEENTPGVDGKEYTLKCTPNFPDSNVKIPPYEVCFLFCNDARKQEEMAVLSKERDTLLVAIKTYRTLFDTSKQLLKELEDASRVAGSETKQIKDKLNNIGYVSITSVTNVSQVSSCLERLNQNRQRLDRTQRRKFGMPSAPDEPGVLGKIGELALVEDEDVAKVLSWHMQSDMDCVITHSMGKARDLHRRMGGRMQLLPLDSIYRKNLPDWGRPLIHCKIQGYNPTGNPIYARELLHFTKEPENCKLVFGMLLGDTIILDTLEEATHYREKIVKHIFCPTLLTRTGERIRSNGKFGGQQNKAPPIDKLRGLIFGEPPLKECDLVAQQIELFESLKVALERQEQVDADLNEQKSQENTREIKIKAKELQVAEKQLTTVENKLGVVKALCRRAAEKIGNESLPLNGVATTTNNGLSSSNTRRRSLQNSSISPSSSRKRKKTS